MDVTNHWYTYQAATILTASQRTWALLAQTLAGSRHLPTSTALRRRPMTETEGNGITGKVVAITGAGRGIAVLPR
jgi:hypothetical protein